LDVEIEPNLSRTASLIEQKEHDQFAKPSAGEKNTSRSGFWAEFPEQQVHVVLRNNFPKNGSLLPFHISPPDRNSILTSTDALFLGCGAFIATQNRTRLDLSTLLRKARCLGTRIQWRMKSIRARFRKSTISVRLIILLLVFFLLEQPVHAYVDPGAGSLLWQLLVAAFVGVLFYLRRLLGGLVRRKKGDKL
jgi:hypothetical protein